MEKTFIVYVVYCDKRRLEDGEKSFSQKILMFYDHQQALDKAYEFASYEVFENSLHIYSPVMYNSNGSYEFEGENKHTWIEIKVKKHIFTGSKNGPCFEYKNWSF